MTEFRLEEYLAQGVAHTVKEILRASLSNPKESAFMLRYAAHAKKPQSAGPRLQRTVCMSRRF